MRRLKRRISWRQFRAWSQFNRLRPLDEARERNELLATQTVYIAQLAGDNGLRIEDLLPDRFDANPSDDMQTVVQAFAGSA